MRETEEVLKEVLKKNKKINGSSSTSSHTQDARDEEVLKLKYLTLRTKISNLGIAAVAVIINRSRNY